MLKHLWSPDAHLIHGGENTPDLPPDNRMVLVVDDEECVLRLVGEILTRSGFAVMGARAGEAGLDGFRLNAGRIAAVLLDVHLPDLDGISLIPMLREIDPDIRIILTSGYLGENRLEQFGPRVSFLQKPFKCRELIAAVEAALNQESASSHRASFPVRARSAA